ncbi:MAG TPA: sigma-70 family RNA polymerase sigma factor [Gaiellaceae bacterium]|nr:sigma-70 family RNA polymerase sigma factor [Gaiellaceae bacterium]
MRKNRRDMELALDSPHLRPVPAAQDAPPPDATDGELLTLVAERDRIAFELLYHRYVRSIFGLALRRLRDRGDAEEAVQEVFAAIWRSAGTYRPERGPATPWIYAVARNAIVDRFRRLRDAPGDLPELVSGEPEPPERAESAYVSWRVHRALEELPRRERDVIELAYWSGMSQSEIADYLDIPLGTVKTRTRTGLARLSDLLEGELR